MIWCFIKTFKIHFVVSCFILYFSSISSPANDGNVISWNGNVKPGKSTKISMAKEVIYVDLSGDNCIVQCKFWFYNHGEQDTVLVGFPAEEFYNDAPGSNPIEDFKSRVNGKAIDVKPLYEQLNIDTVNNDEDGATFYDTTSYRKWYVKEVVFKAHDTTFIEDAYYTGWQASSGSYFTDKTFEYIIGTGSTWFGPIGDGTIVFDYSNFASAALLNRYSIDDKFDLDGYTGIQYSIYRFKNRAPNPKDVLSISFFDVDNMWLDDMDKQSVGDENTFSYKNFVEQFELTPARIILLKNEILAKFGYVFKDTTIRKYYSAMKWYKPDKNLSLKGFNHPLYDIIKKKNKLNAKKENELYLKLLEILEKEKSLQNKCAQIRKTYEIPD